jgi:hypothetical protein
MPRPAHPLSHDDVDGNNNNDNNKKKKKKERKKESKGKVVSVL